ncbi:MAG: putative nucleic acid-binding protein [Rhodothermales bacterium]|jgi:predicted nucleic acid-binding protein
MIVVDTDVVAYSFLRKDAERAVLADAVVAKDKVWAAPPLWIAEYRNVLATHIRFREMGLEEARRLAIAAEGYMDRHSIPVATEDVLRLVAASKCTAYDCEFVAAAQSIGVKLVTGDRKLAAAFPETAVTMEEFVGA